MSKHPIQPLVVVNGRLRFKPNAIARHLLDHGGIDMNAIARMEFSQDDREQFAQLIGYSHDGAGSLSYFSDETWHAAEAMHSAGKSEHEARADHLREQLDDARQLIRSGVARLFGMHEDDLP